MKNDANNQLASIRRTIVFGGAAIPAFGSLFFAYRVLEATHPRAAYVILMLTGLTVIGMVVAWRRKRSIF